MKKLYRSSTNKMLAGICGGLEDFTNIDATLWRILFVIIALPGGLSIFIYLLLWFIIPSKPSLSDETKPV